MEDIIEILRDQKGQDIVLLEVSKKIDWAKYMIIVTGLSKRHLNAMGGAIIREYKNRRSFNIKPSVDGINSDDWVVIDTGDMLVQILNPQKRKELNLEGLWGFKPNITSLADDYELIFNYDSEASSNEDDEPENPETLDYWDDPNLPLY